MAKTAAHIRYRTSNGAIVPGVTTFLNILNKPALVPWANKLGLQGIDSSKYVDDKAAIGTLAHYMILCHLEGEEPDISDYSSKQIDQAETCLIKFWDWEKNHTLQTILSEQPLISEMHGFGGTVDWYGLVDDVATLIDFKTGSGIYPEMVYQLSCYDHLLMDNGHYVHSSQIVRVGRNENEGFETRIYTSLSDAWELSLHCLVIYNLQKKMKGS